MYKLYWLFCQQGIPSVYWVLRNDWDTLGPFLLLARHPAEITAADRQLADTVLAFYG